MTDSNSCNSDYPDEYYNCFMKGLEKRNPHEDEFIQAVGEVADSLKHFLLDNKKYLDAQILERMTEPDRVISFRVCWEDDKGNVRTNRGYRVQFNNAIGPYKGGLRFHPTVNQSVLKFLGFEQIFKNSLTGLQIGAGKGGANFNPKGKSDREIMRFCQAYMTELSKHIGESTDVPAGDIGVGAREISFLFGQYKRLKNEFTGAITGKGLEFGGSLVRTEATGFGLVYFAEQALNNVSKSLEGQSCLVSGAGNVAQYAALKLMEKGAKVLSLSDSSGCMHFPKGLNEELLKDVQQLKREGKSLAELDTDHGQFHENKTPWDIEANFAFPCATQNEIDTDDANTLIDNGIRGVFEGANMPTTNEAIRCFRENDVLFAPGKAANAGGVAISALEMSQNAVGMQYDREHVDGKLQEIMADIHETCVKYGVEPGQDDGAVDYVKGANIGGFVRVADAMLAFGIN